MLTTKRKPVTVGEILVEEFLRPLGLTQGALAEAMGVPRKHVNQLCNDRAPSPPRPRSSSRACSATARISGSTCNAALIFGRRCIPPASWRASSERSRCRAQREADQLFEGPHVIVPIEKKASGERPPAENKSRRKAENSLTTTRAKTAPSGILTFFFFKREKF